MIVCFSAAFLGSLCSYHLGCGAWIHGLRGLAWEWGIVNKVFTVQTEALLQRFGKCTFRLVLYCCSEVGRVDVRFRGRLFITLSLIALSVSLLLCDEQ